MNENFQGSDNVFPNHVSVSSSKFKYQTVIVFVSIPSSGKPSRKTQDMNYSKGSFDLIGSAQMTDTQVRLIKYSDVGSFHGRSRPTIRKNTEYFPVVISTEIYFTDICTKCYFCRIEEQHSSLKWNSYYKYSEERLFSFMLVFFVCSMELMKENFLFYSFLKHVFRTFLFLIKARCWNKEL